MTAANWETRVWRWVLAGLLLVQLAGCSQEESAQTADTQLTEPLMQRVSLDEWEYQLAEYPPNILVVDYWATWCAPCIERFPYMVEMAERYAEQGVTFVSYNLDEPDDEFSELQAEDFLLAMDAGFEHFATSVNVFDTMKWLGLESIPAVSIYDRSGVEATRLTGDLFSGQVFDETAVETAILAVLKDQPLPQ